MAKKARKAWKRPGSPIGKTGPRKANPKYKRNNREPWTTADIRMLKELAKGNTPTGVMSLKMGRTPAAIRNKAGLEGISLKPINRSPRTSAKKTTRGAATRGRKAAGKKSATRTTAAKRGAAKRGG